MQLRLVRYLPSGRVDSSFAAAGRTTAAIEPAYDTLGLALEREGGILVAGSSLVSKATRDQQLAVWRFDQSGRLDRSFGAGGVLEVNPTSGRINLDYLTHVTAQTDGRIVAAGGSAKPRTGFDSGLLNDVVVLRAR